MIKIFHKLLMILSIYLEIHIPMFKKIIIIKNILEK